MKDTSDQLTKWLSLVPSFSISSDLNSFTSQKSLTSLPQFFKNSTLHITSDTSLTLIVPLHLEYGGRIGYLHGGYNYFIMQLAIAILADKLGKPIEGPFEIAYLRKIQFDSTILVKATASPEFTAEIYNMNLEKCSSLRFNRKFAKF